MNHYRKTWLALTIILSPLAGFSQAENALLQIGQKITLKSEILNETREVWIYLPPNYSDKNFQPQNYPVLYLLDGDLHFHSLSGLVQILASGVNFTFAIPELIIVAIPNTNRTRDLTPTHSTRDPDGKEQLSLSESGGADKFLKFLSTELAPKIESSYRTSPYRILIGHSFGGIAAIRALYTMPAFFNAYVAIDPSLWWDSQLLVKQAREYFNKSNLKGRSLFLGQANTHSSWDSVNQHFEDIKEFAALLESRNRSGLRFKYKYYPDDTHSSVAFISEYDALRFIFETYSLNYVKISSPKDLKEQYEQLTNETGVKFLPPERITQHFGSIYMYLEKYDIAEGFFKMNIENYPNSSSAYANMGQYWRIKGDKKKALDYYEQSIKIFPDNKDSRNNLERLKKELDAKK